MGNIVKSANKHADIIMSAIAIGGFLTTLYFVIKRTPRANDMVLDAFDRMEDIIEEAEVTEEREEIVNARLDLEKLYLVRDLGILYAPAIISGVCTIGCIVGSCHHARANNAYISGALNASNIAYQEYRDRVKAAFGEKAEGEVAMQIQEDHVNRATMPPLNRITETGNGDMLCAMEIEKGDPDTMIFFRSSRQACDNALNRFNAYLMSEAKDHIATQEDLLYFLGIRLKGGGSQIRHVIFRDSEDLLTFSYGSFVHERTGEAVLLITVDQDWRF